MRNKRKSARTAEIAESAEPERYVLWRNDGPRAHDEVVFDDEHIVREWTCLRSVSVPERFSDQCEALGLTRVRYARD